MNIGGNEKREIRKWQRIPLENQNGCHLLVVLPYVSQEEGFSSSVAKGINKMFPDSPLLSTLELS